MNSEYTYEGSELELFRHARNWKAYWRKQIMPFMGLDILDVGAGLGATAELFADYGCNSWLALEPDGRMASALIKSVSTQAFPSGFSAQQGTLAALDSRQRFDTILYIDVLEHIEDDQGEMDRAGMLLQPGGHLIILCPAFQFLFSPFDKAIGHFRRYSKKQLRALQPSGCSSVASFYLDSAGMLASLANKLVLKSSQPSSGSIRFWDSALVPVSRVTDWLCRPFFGRSVVQVWQKDAADESINAPDHKEG